MHPHTMALGIAVFLVGLLLLFIGGVAVIFTVTGFFAISTGVFVMIVGGVIALIGYFV
jgi:hypothetical protein